MKQIHQMPGDHEDGHYITLTVDSPNQDVMFLFFTTNRDTYKLLEYSSYNVKDNAMPPVQNRMTIDG